MANITHIPAPKPRKLEKTSPTSTFCHPAHTSTEGPAEAIPAPAKPATNAWLSLVGIPHRAATLDQMMMPTIAPPTVAKLTALGSMIPVPMVVATAVPDITPIRLNTDARASAARGESERVPTTVAMAFGASVQPFTNSAPRMRRRTARSSRFIVLAARV